MVTRVTLQQLTLSGHGAIKLPVAVLTSLSRTRENRLYVFNPFPQSFEIISQRDPLVVALTLVYAKSPFSFASEGPFELSYRILQWDTR
jgi:hypothetical protein